MVRNSIGTVALGLLLSCGGVGCGAVPDSNSQAASSADTASSAICSLGSDILNDPNNAAVEETFLTGAAADATRIGATLEGLATLRSSLLKDRCSYIVAGEEVQAYGSEINSLVKIGNQNYSKYCLQGGDIAYVSLLTGADDSYTLESWYYSRPDNSDSPSSHRLETGTLTADGKNASAHFALLQAEPKSEITQSDVDFVASLLRWEGLADTFGHNALSVEELRTSNSSEKIGSVVRTQSVVRSDAIPSSLRAVSHVDKAQTLQLQGSNEDFLSMSGPIDPHSSSSWDLKRGEGGKLIVDELRVVEIDSNKTWVSTELQLCPQPKPVQ